jgi:6-phosphogluconolactonase (cycloisomerase 2 family)
MDHPRRGDGTKPLRRLALATAVSAVGALAFALPAHAATGDLLYQGCLTGDTNVGPAGSNACSLTGIPAASGTDSGLNAAWAVAMSPDGSSLYALAQGDDAIARFSRNPSTGVLTYQDCITGKTESGPTGSNACSVISTHQSQGVNSGFDQPYGIVISPNGASVYVSAVDDDSVLRFDRNTGTGALTYQGCITGELASGNGGGNNACTAIPSDTAGGDNSGLEKVRALAIDPNGETLYASGPADDSIARFTRDSGTGALTYQDCLTAENATGPAVNNSCAALPGIVAGGTNSGFDNPQAITVSPNGASVYVASGNDASITRFGRTPVTGTIALQDCLTRDTSVVVGAGCTQVTGGTAGGTESGFDNFRAVAVSSNGTSLYALAGGDSSIVNFNRDTGTGALTFISCITGESQIGPATGTNKCSTQVASATPNGDQSGWGIFGNAPTLAINGAGTAVYFATNGDDSVVQLDRDTGSGSLAFRRCLTAETESAAGCTLISPSASFGVSTAFDAPNGLALSADGRSLYTTSSNSDTIATFAVEQAPTVTPPVTNPPAAVPKKKRCKKKAKKGAAAGKKKCKKKKKG